MTLTNTRIVGIYNHRQLNSSQIKSSPHSIIVITVILAVANRQFENGQPTHYLAVLFYSTMSVNVIIAITR